MARHYHHHLAISMNADDAQIRRFLAENCGRSETGLRCRLVLNVFILGINVFIFGTNLFQV